MLLLEIFIRKMDISGKKNVEILKTDSFSNTLNRFHKWNFVPIGGSSPPDPLRSVRDRLQVAGASPPRKKPGDASEIHA